jgi:hypothetical protein
MNHLFKLLNTLFVFSILFYSCDNEKEIIPSYLHIDKFSFTSNPVTQGLNTAEIVSAKVFVNGKEIGNFELPATFPVLFDGKAIVDIFPNVRENGSSNNQKYFKVYTSFSDTLDLSPERIDTIRPKSTYRSNCTFDYIEDFEDGGISLIKSGGNSTNDTLRIISTSTPGVDQPFTGSKFCGFVQVNSDSFFVFERSTSSVFNSWPNLGKDIYFEMDIKSNISLQVGLYTDDGLQVRQVPVLVANETQNTWKKIYVNFKTETGDLPLGTKYRVFLGFFKDNSEYSEVKVYLDNLKVVYVN